MPKSHKELLSMTGFGRANAEVKSASIVCEVRGVNHRGLDVKFRLPSALFAFETEFLKVVSKRFTRGRIDIFIDVVDEHPDAKHVAWHDAAASDLVEQVARFQKKNPHVKGEIKVGDLLGVRELFSMSERKFAPRDLHVGALKVLEEAIADALEARAEEGKRLKVAIVSSLKASEHLTLEISKKLSSSSERHVKELRKKVTQLLVDNELDELRMAQEVAWIAERADVTEEIERLHAHLEHFRQLCEAGGAIGRKLDFLCQEMFREANTASSKITDVQTTYLVVDLKSEIERIREQVQNIE